MFCAIEVSSRSPTFYGFSLGENDAKMFCEMFYCCAYCFECSDLDYCMPMTLM